MRQLVATSLVLIGSFIGYRAFSAQVLTAEKPHFQASPAASTVRCVTKDIEKVSRFDWIIGQNPEGCVEGEDVEAIDWRQWRFIDTRLVEPDGTVSEVNLARPVTWLEAEQAAVGSKVYMDLPEMGIKGWADVIDIRPAIDPGPRPSLQHSLVTATFKHTAAKTIDLVIEDTAPIGCTPNHPFWSVDRHDFIEAGNLEIGERVQLATGDTKRVLQSLPRPGPETVHNFEVHGQHVYHVGTTGVLVHNGCQVFPANPKKFKPKGLMRVKGNNGKYTWREFRGLDASGKPIYGKKLYEYHPGHPHNPASGFPDNPLRSNSHYHKNLPAGPGNKNIHHHVPPPGGGDPHLAPGTPVF
jgi:hypothetical protein